MLFVVGDRLAADELDGLRGGRRGGEDRVIVLGEKLDPSGDVSGVLAVVIDAELRADERGRQLGDELLGGIGAIAEAPAEAAIEPVRRAVPMAESWKVVA